MNNLFNIINLVEKLKLEKRHSWLSNNDQESVAEHSFRLSFMVLSLAAELKEPIDVYKALKMAIIHDLPEIHSGDIPAFAIDEKREESEDESMRKICACLREGEQFYALWEEFEKRESREAKFVYALDRLECIMQHLQADINTWIEVEKKRIYLGASYYCAFDPHLKAFADYVTQKGREKMQRAGIDLEPYRKWEESKSIEELLLEAKFSVVYEQ